MSARTYFQLRYAVPGYTFLLMLILVGFTSFEEISAILESTAVGAFLAFFSLLGGGALGFLISQVWYVLHIRFRRTKFGELPQLIKLLQKHYNLTDDADHQVVFADYIHRLASKQTLIYTQRRFDLMHMFGSTCVALVLGAFIGLLVRLESISSTLWLQDVIASLPNFTPNLRQISTYDFAVALTFIALLALLIFGLRHASKEYSMAFHFSVKEVLAKEGKGWFPHAKAETIFTEEYFKKEKKKDSSPE